MLTIKQLKTQLKLNDWERQKAIIDRDHNRLIELNTAHILLLEILIKELDNKLNQKQLVSKVS